MDRLIDGEIVVADSVQPMDIDPPIQPDEPRPTSMSLVPQQHDQGSSSSSGVTSTTTALFDPVNSLSRNIPSESSIESSEVQDIAPRDAQMIVQAAGQIVGAFMRSDQSAYQDTTDDPIEATGQEYVRECLKSVIHRRKSRCPSLLFLPTTANLYPGPNSLGSTWCQHDSRLARI